MIVSIYNNVLFISCYCPQEMCRLAQIEYGDQIRKAEDERKELLEERRKEKYDKHYKICQQVICCTDI